MQGEHKLAQVTLYCQTSFYYKWEFFCAVTDIEEFALDLLASKNIACISFIPASPEIQPFTISP